MYYVWVLRSVTSDMCVFLKSFGLYYLPRGVLCSSLALPTPMLEAAKEILALRTSYVLSIPMPGSISEFSVYNSAQSPVLNLHCPGPQTIQLQMPG